MPSASPAKRIVAPSQFFSGWSFDHWEKNCSGRTNANRRGIDAYATVFERFSSHQIFSSESIFLEQTKYEHFGANFSLAMPKRATKTRFFSSHRK